MKLERQCTTLYPAAYIMQCFTASKSNIIYAGEENTTQILSDLNTKIMRSKKEHCMCSHGADFYISEKCKFYSIFGNKIEQFYEKLIILFNFQKFEIPPHDCAENALFYT